MTLLILNGLWGALGTAKLVDMSFKNNTDILNLGINKATPQVMHVDMNSCFATIEQQANPLLRGRPIGVSSYTTPKGIVLAPSIEAKALGIKLGMKNYECKKIAPEFVSLPVDAPKYRDAHIRFKKIFMSYTNNVVPKSIDEAVIDFTNSPIIKQKDMVGIGVEIKQRVKDEIGDWVRVNVGIGSNRFLAKTAAGINKPDGLEFIDHKNLLKTLKKLELLDLTGINVRYRARLNAKGIFTPLDLYDAPALKLKKEVFNSIIGVRWYLRLRGWEVDNAKQTRKTFGHQYALGKKTADRTDLARLIMKLSEKTGRRLRQAKYRAYGLHISLTYNDYSHWHKGQKTRHELYTSVDIFKAAMNLFDKQPSCKVVKKIAITVYNLKPVSIQQIDLFEDINRDLEYRVSRACDDINDSYGEFTVTPAIMMEMNKTILDRISFGKVSNVEDLYASTEN